MHNNIQNKKIQGNIISIKIKSFNWESSKTLYDYKNDNIAKK